MNRSETRHLHVTGLFVALTLFGVSAIWGCATYVNIPAQAGDLAAHDPNKENVHLVQGHALQAVLDDRPIQVPFSLVLPPGSRPETHQAVAERLEPQPISSDEETDDALPQVRVSQVRIRGWIAQVDIVRPAADTTQLVTVYLKWEPFAGWHVERMRAWQLPVGEAIQHSRQESQTALP